MIHEFLCLRDLIDLIQEENKEWGFLFNEDGELLDIIEGQAHCLPMEGAYVAPMYHLVHNHPAGRRNFSWGDIMYFQSHHLMSFTTITADGQWITISLPEYEGQTADWVDFPRECKTYDEVSIPDLIRAGYRVKGGILYRKA